MLIKHLHLDVPKGVAMFNNHLFNPNPIDFTAQSGVFFGEGRNVARLELNTQPHIAKLTDQSIGKYWIPTEFPYAEDGKDYTGMNKPLQDLYMKNLKFQTVLDSVASRTVSEVFFPITTDPNLASWWVQHAFFEDNIHSKTYSEILKALPVDTLSIFDDIMVNPAIIERAKDILQYFEQAVQWNAKRLLNTSDYSLHAHKRSVILSLYAMHILEAILFKSSFLTSFSFKENGLMSATADAISRISLDETGHYALVTHLLTTHKSNPEWAHIFAEVESEAISMYRTAAEADNAWIEYLFEDEPQLLGISEATLKQYVQYNTNKVMATVSLELIYEDTFNPCTWANKYDKLSSFQTAQKEKVSGNYSIGALAAGMTAEDWEIL